jgi:hypothetical protein
MPEKNFPEPKNPKIKYLVNREHPIAWLVWTGEGMYMRGTWLPEEYYDDIESYQNSLLKMPTKELDILFRQEEEKERLEDEKKSKEDWQEFRDSGYSFKRKPPDKKKLPAILNPKERITFLKLIIGMAVKGYSYNPEATKSTSVKDIADDLHALGLDIDEDTVRKWLKEAAKILPKGWNTKDA